MSTLFNALKYGIKARNRADFVNEKAFSLLYDSLLSKSFVALKMMLSKKKKCRQKAIRLRKIHLQNLAVKSFSTLLFNAKTKIKVRRLEQMADYFI